jgi:hypothetical protein
MIVEGWDSVIGIATRYQLDVTGCEAGRGKRFSLLHPRQDRSQDPPSLLYNAFWALSRVYEWLGRGFDHPYRSSAEFRKE